MLIHIISKINQLTIRNSLNITKGNNLDVNNNNENIQNLPNHIPISIPIIVAGTGGANPDSINLNNEQNLY